ncbi:hypothetical protein KFK09_026611 [Dendrobium nobile]|uniref:Uncharacterized protein n=1 Tax=Dendrobium nobile TaxID=94219 RepID=A0A8T3A805_DENNO|nr:hypothetical protein KFK09_026611 [Dendrobium nobile]
MGFRLPVQSRPLEFQEMSFPMRWLLGFLPWAAVFRALPLGSLAGCWFSTPGLFPVAVAPRFHAISLSPAMATSLPERMRVSPESHQSPGGSSGSLRDANAIEDSRQSRKIWKVMSNQMGLDQACRRLKCR